MSLNKFTDGSVKQQWMNIGCNRLNCNTLTADNVNVPLGEFEQLLINDTDTPQLLITPDEGNDAVVNMRSFNSLLQFQDENTNATGYFISNDTGFFIDAEDRDAVIINGGVQFKTGSEPSVPIGGYTTLYSKGDGDFVAKTVENVPYHICNTRFVQTQPQQVVGGDTDVYVDILESTSLGIGSLQIKSSEQEICVYELKFSGRYDIVTAPKTLRFALWENGGISIVVTRNITLPVGQGEFDGTLYIVFGDAISGVARNVFGNVQFNGSAPGDAEILPIPPAIDIGPAEDILYGLRVAWSAGSTTSDSITVLASTMNRLY